MDNIQFPTLEQMIYLIGMTNSEDESDEIKGIETFWDFVDSELLDYDLGKGYSTETIILRYKSTGQLFATDLDFDGYEGYDITEEPLEWVEMRGYIITTTKYRPIEQDDQRKKQSGENTDNENRGAQ